MSCIKPSTAAAGIGLGLIGALACGLTARALELKLSSDFPGGNFRVLRNAGASAVLAPDYRDSNPWFYWQFEATPDAAGRARFSFPDPPRLGLQGPAVSLDGGASWRWLGTGSVQSATAEDAFAYAFTNVGRAVRFAVAIPYGQRELDAFLAGRPNDPRLAVGVLAATAKGRPVELLQIGEPGPGRLAMLVTARHHACESMASYVLEGFMAEALSDSPAGAAFRSRYVLYAVPIVDKDGVIAGDQGKGRQPHDHNRDYGPTNRYPEVRAIQALGRDKKIELALDFHCPALRGESHEFFYFDGLAVPPTASNVAELADWLGEEGPQVFARGPFPWLKAPSPVRGVANLPFSLYFAGQPSVRMAATLEVPYATAYAGFDAAMARNYGAALLRAWTRMEFAGPGQPRTDGHAAYEAFSKRMEGLIKSKPEEAERLAAGILAETGSTALYRSEVRLRLGDLRARQKRFGEALAELDAVAADPGATERQRTQALARRVLAVCRDPVSGTGAVDAALAAFSRIAHPAQAQESQVHAAASGYFERANLLGRALSEARLQHAAAPWYEKGRTLNRIAALLDKTGKPGEALDCRRQAVAQLRRQLDPVPRGVFGALMAADLCVALAGIPTATEAERNAAAEAARSHPLQLEEAKRRIQTGDRNEL